jgi:hypothetical protein
LISVCKRALTTTTTIIIIDEQTCSTNSVNGPISSLPIRQ